MCLHLGDFSLCLTIQLVGPLLPILCCFSFLLLFYFSPGFLLASYLPAWVWFKVWPLFLEISVVDCVGTVTLHVLSVQRSVEGVLRAVSFTGMWSFHVDLVVWSDQRDSWCPRCSGPGVLVCLMTVIFLYLRVAAVAGNFTCMQAWHISDLTSPTLFPNFSPSKLAEIKSVYCLEHQCYASAEVSSWKLESRGHFTFLTVLFREEFSSTGHFLWECV